MAKEQKKLKVPEEKLQELGVNVEQLKKNPETWQALVSGRKTPLLNLKGECCGKPIYFAAKLHLWENEKGEIEPYLHTVKSDISLHAYKNKGHEFSSKEIGMLLSDEGMINHPVVLKFGEKEVPCLIGVDKDTKEICHLPISNVHLPEDFLGVKTTKEQREIVRSGGKVYFPELTRTDGTKFSSVVYFSFQRNNGEGGLIFKTPTPKLLQEMRIDSGKSEGKEEAVEKRQEEKKSQNVMQMPTTTEKKISRKSSPKI